MSVKLSDAELADRKKAWKEPAPKAASGVLAKYIRLVRSASKAALQTWNLRDPEFLSWPSAHNNCVPAIFLSYRRSDSVGAAGRLFDRLAEHFGADQVFRDIDSIEAGENFEESIRNALRLATVVLVVIGPRWLEARSQDGARRIDDPADYVRREIKLALSSTPQSFPACRGRCLASA